MANLRKACVYLRSYRRRLFSKETKKAALSIDLLAEKLRAKLAQSPHICLVPLSILLNHVT